MDIGARHSCGRSGWQCGVCLSSFGGKVPPQEEEKAKEKKVDDDLKSNAGEKNRISKKSDFVFPEHAFSVRSIAIILTTILM